MNLVPQDRRQSETDSGSRVEWEEPNCLLCGGDQWWPLVEAPDNAEGGSGLWFAVVQCQKCGLCFTNPRPTEATIGRFYLPTYKPHQTVQAARSGNWGGRIKHIVGWPASERKVLPVEGKGRLLDFGCGGGSYLLRMHRQGWQVTGLDSSPEAVRRVREELRLPALVGSLPCWDLASASFDVITMWQVLEHVHEPLEVLREAYRLLTPGGRLVVSVPNIDSLAFRLFGSWWSSLDLPRHLTHFTPSTLHLMLERAGFRVRPIRMVRHSQWLRTSAKLACRQERVRRWQRWLRAKPASRVTTWYGYLTQQADCMVVSAER
jgi:SAM-dependent methyltransferase